MSGEASYVWPGRSRSFAVLGTQSPFWYSPNDCMQTVLTGLKSRGLFTPVVIYMGALPKKFEPAELQYGCVGPGRIAQFMMAAPCPQV
jgi:hypothetical protein